MHARGHSLQVRVQAESSPALNICGACLRTPDALHMSVCVCVCVCVCVLVPCTCVCACPGALHIFVCVPWCAAHVCMPWCPACVFAPSGAQDRWPACVFAPSGAQDRWPACVFAPSGAQGRWPGVWLVGPVQAQRLHLRSTLAAPTCAAPLSATVAPQRIPTELISSTPLVHVRRISQAHLSGASPRRKSQAHLSGASPRRTSQAHLSGAPRASSPLMPLTRTRLDTLPSSTALPSRATHPQAPGHLPQQHGSSGAIHLGAQLGQGPHLLRVGTHAFVRVMMCMRVYVCVYVYVCGVRGARMLLTRACTCKVRGGCEE